MVKSKIENKMLLFFITIISLIAFILLFRILTSNTTKQGDLNNNVLTEIEKKYLSMLDKDVVNLVEKYDSFLITRGFDSPPNYSEDRNNQIKLAYDSLEKDINKFKEKTKKNTELFRKEYNNRFTQDSNNNFLTTEYSVLWENLNSFWELDTKEFLLSTDIDSQYYYFDSIRDEVFNIKNNRNQKGIENIFSVMDDFLENMLMYPLRYSIGFIMLSLSLGFFIKYLFSLISIIITVFHKYTYEKAIISDKYSKYNNFTLRLVLESGEIMTISVNQTNYVHFELKEHIYIIYKNDNYFTLLNEFDFNKSKYNNN